MREDYEHRVIYYDAHGAGPFACNWCGIIVTWADLEIDHVNAIKTDNALSNIVASCPSCNKERARAECIIAIRKAIGRMVTAFGRTMCISEWAREVGIAAESLRWRLERGWPIEQALSQPRGKFGPPRGRPKSKG